MRSDLTLDIAQQVSRVEPERLRQHVERIAAFGPRSTEEPAGVAETLGYLKDTLQQYGYQVREEPFGSLGHEVNIIVQRTGMSQAERVIEVGAHYDTVRGSPGADDNASGVAGVLEIARLLSGIALQRTVRLCLFGAEESGLRGSQQHVAQLASPPDELLEGILVFEMIGYCTHATNSQRTPLRIPLIFWPPRIGNSIVVVSNFPSRRLATAWQSAARRFVPELPMFVVKRLGGVIKDAARSDHVPYWKARRRGLMITDTANFRNPHYHRASDLPETLDYEFAAAVTRATLAMLLQWARL